MTGGAAQAAILAGTFGGQEANVQWRLVGGKQGTWDAIWFAEERKREQRI